MKNILKTSLASTLAIILLVFNACDDTSELFEISSPVAPVLADVGITDIELDANNTDNPALTLSWVEADYGQQVSVNYAIEFSSDDVFTTPVVSSMVTGTNTVTLSTSELNAAAGNTGLNPFEWATIYVRVVASLGTQSGVKSTSNTVQFRVYPYFNYVFDDYYLVGNGTAPNWNNNDNNPALFRDHSNSSVFYYTGYFDKPTADAGDGRFKVLETKGLWQPQWGTTYPDGSDPIETSGGIAGNPGTQSNDPGRFGVTASGYYTFMIDFSTKQYSITPFDATGHTSPTAITVEGSSTTATALTALAFDGHIWYVNNIHLTPGDVQFMLDGTAWGSTTGFSGVATNGGGSIPVVVEDDYDIWFNDLTGQYILIPLNL